MLDFVEFIRQRCASEIQERHERAAALRGVFKELQALPQAQALSEADIRAEIAAHRAERRCAKSGLSLTQTFSFQPHTGRFSYE